MTQRRANCSLGMRHRLRRAVATTPTDHRRRASEDVARGGILLRVLPGGPGATIPGTERRPGQTVGRARGLSGSTASDPTPASSLMDYQNSTAFSSYRVPLGRHKRLLANSSSWPDTIARFLSGRLSHGSDATLPRP